ncbi:NAD+ synthase [Desulfobacterota bacterium M19]
MKTALAQINPVIGDFDFNLSRMRYWITRARRSGCELIVFPELAVSGYPPQDLLERRGFVENQLTALDKFLAETEGIAVLCGVVTRHRDSGAGRPFHNSALLYAHGRWQWTHKRLLPTYDVFDEARYFEPGRQSAVLTLDGIKLGITVCEDIFNYQGLEPAALGGGGSRGIPARRYTVDPLTDLLTSPAGGPDILINIAASPFSLGKCGARTDFFHRVCRRTGLPLLYVNQVGGQDSLLFDGHSLALNPDGGLTAMAAGFREDMIVVDSAVRPRRTGLEVNCRDTPPERFALDALCMGTADYVWKCGFKSAVLGLSGGIDSALCAVIAARALGAENVLGVALPSPYTAPESISDARALALNLGINFEIMAINDIFSAERQTLAPLFTGLKEDVTEQNLQARIRGSLLMALSNKFGHMLLSTGNKSELAVGYCTLYGDMSGGLAVISDVPKTLVYDICRYINLEGEVIPANIIQRPPSAELAPDQRDDDDLPPYEILDPILFSYLEENKTMAEIIAQGFEAGVVRDVIRRVNINEYKRQQAAVGLRLTAKAFGCGRRYPITQRYLEDV